jgi:DNA-binding NarL/FixJ family response regulator
MKRRILFVEDEMAFAVGLIDRLEQEGYTVEWAQTGKAGYDLALACAFDLIVLDVTGIDYTRSKNSRGPLNSERSADHASVLNCARSNCMAPGCRDLPLYHASAIS